MVLVSVGAASCAHGVKDVVSRGAEGGVGGSLTGLTDPENREMMIRLLQDEGIQKAAHDLSAALTGGALDGLTEEERGVRVREATDSYIKTVAGSLRGALDDELSPAVSRAIRGALGGGIAAALRPANGELARQFTDQVVRGVVVAFAETSAQGLREDVGPALAKVLAEDLGPALAKVIAQDLGPALHKAVYEDLLPEMEGAMLGDQGGASGVFVRAITRQIVLGVNDGMSELGVSLSPNREDGLGIAGWILFVLGALLLVLAALLTRLFFNNRALANDRIRSEEMLVNILREIKSSESGEIEPPKLATVIARVHQQVPDVPDSYIATLIGRAQLPPRAPAALGRAVAAGDAGMSSKSSKKRPGMNDLG